VLLFPLPLFSSSIDFPGVRVRAPVAQLSWRSNALGSVSQSTYGPQTLAVATAVTSVVAVALAVTSVVTAASFTPEVTYSSQKKLSPKKKKNKNRIKFKN
jgi:hypothetical protein